MLTKSFFSIFLFLLFAKTTSSQIRSSIYFFQLPKEVETESVETKKLTDSIRLQLKLKSLNIKQEMLQQFGLNEKNDTALNTYFRYFVTPIENNSYNYYLIKKEFEKDYRSESTSYAKILKQEFENSIDCKSGCFFSEIKGDTCMIGGYMAVPIYFSRKSKITTFNNQDIFTSVYYIFTKSKPFLIKASYIKKDENKWVPIVNVLNKQVHFF
jgi:hypothetical protein